MKLNIALISLLVCLLPLGAQIADYYSFAHSTETYTPITGTTITNLSADDAMSSPLAIGFSFPYCGQVYQTLRISTNGWINPGGTTDSSMPTNNIDSTIFPVIAPLWDDNSMQGGNVQYLLSGEAPNRCFTVQYYHTRWNYTATNYWFDFQVQLYENGLIKFVYGSCFGVPVSANATIGINMAPANSGDFWSVTPGYPPTASSTTENNQVAFFPDSGEVYSFVPPPLVLRDLSVTTISSTFNLDLNQEFSTSITVKNNASLPFSDYDVTLSQNNIEIARISGIELQPNESHVFTVTASIDSSGLKTVTGTAELDADENPANNSKSFVCIVRPDPAAGIVYGAGDELLRIPIDLWWKYSLYETLYYPAEIGETGLIYGISFFNDYFQSHYPDVLKLWVGETSIPDLSMGWIPASQLSQVFDMGYILPAGENEIYIPFSEPFHYHGQNLVIMAYQSHTYYFTGDVFFQSQTLPGPRARNQYSDMYDPDPNNPQANITSNGQVPKIAFYMIPIVANDDEYIPSAAAFSNYPNPFNSQTTFSFGEAKSPTRVDIFNLKGQKVRSLTGTELSWDGCDETGKQLSAGIYLARMKQGEKLITKKVCKQ